VLAEFMYEVMQGKHGANLRERMSATTWLAERGFGKPRLAEERTQDDPLEELLAYYSHERSITDMDESDRKHSEL